MESMPFARESKIFAQLEERARVANLTKTELEQYQISLKHLRDYNNAIQSNYELGLARGEAKGREEGREEERLTLVTAMLDSGLTKEQVAEIARLSVEELDLLIAGTL